MKSLNHSDRGDAGTVFLLVLLLALVLALALELGSAKTANALEKRYKVDFRDAPLRDVVYTVAEYLSKGFVFSSSNQRINWTQGPASGPELFRGFQAAMETSGFVLVRRDHQFYQIFDREKGGGQGKGGRVVLPLQWVSGENVKTAIETAFGDRVKVAGLPNLVVLSGDADTVHEAFEIVRKMDTSHDDLKVIKLKHLLVRDGMKALEGLSILQDEQSKAGIVPDYWNRSIMVRGTAVQRIVATMVLGALDQPGKRADQVIRLHNIKAEDAVKGHGKFKSPKTR